MKNWIVNLKGSVLFIENEGAQMKSYRVKGSAKLLLDLT
jgi:hypothetical protein